MQRIAFMLALSLPLAPLACGKGQIDDKPKAEAQDAKPVDSKPASPDAKVAALDAAASKVGFVGAKVTAEHEGSFGTIDGNATFEGDKPVGLEITVKVDSLTIEPDKLQEHLLSPDLFDAAAHPEAKFVSTSIQEKAGEGGTTHLVEGNLSLHGETKSISFPAKLEVSAGSAKGTAEFTIDRKQFGIVYPGMPDDLIKDEVLLKLDLSFKRS